MMAILYSLACVLAVLAHFADFLLQAHQHGWILYTYRDGYDKYGNENRGRKKPTMGYWTFRQWAEDFQDPNRAYGVRSVVVVEYRWRLYANGKKWHWLIDWFPHDQWHWVQFTRNMGWLFSAALTVYTLPDIGAWALLVAWGMWVVARGIGFTVPMNLSPNVTKAAGAAGDEA